MSPRLIKPFVTTKLQEERMLKDGKSPKFFERKHRREQASAAADERLKAPPAKIKGTSGWVFSKPKK